MGKRQKKQTDCSRSSLRFCEKSRRSGNRPFILKLYSSSMQKWRSKGRPQYSQSCLKWGASLARCGVVSSERSDREKGLQFGEEFIFD